MYAETEGIVLKQVKAANGRRMVLLFSEKYGKVSAGTSINEGGRSQAALAMRPFTHGRYGIYKNRSSYNISGAEAVKAYYRIGEDVEKYACASYVLEFTEKLLPENAPDRDLFKLLIDFMDLIDTRKKGYMTLVAAFQLKAIQLAGLAPEMRRCVRCGGDGELKFLSVAEGGMVCGGCGGSSGTSGNGGSDADKAKHTEPDNVELIYSMDFDIIKAMHYFFGNSLKSIEHIALNEKILEKLMVVIRGYSAYHLCINELKSEALLEI